MTQIASSNVKRVVLLILDGFGVGALPDASEYGDAKTVNTLASISKYKRELHIPNLQKMGLANIIPLDYIQAVEKPIASHGKAKELSKGKDTSIGHWEIAGIHTKKAFASFPQGFPLEFVESFSKEVNISGVLANKKASGTAIIEEFGEEHIRTKKPILYTSEDSVLQLACHEKHFGLEKLYSICEKAREKCDSLNIARVIARPFVGEKRGAFKRTENRKDYSIPLAEKTILNYIQEAGKSTISIGKVADIYNHMGFSEEKTAKNNKEIMKVLLEELANFREAFIFANFVDFDMLYGHRRDPEGYAKELEWFDRNLSSIISLLKDEDLLIITADHGNDPMARGTDHTREYIPILAYSVKSQIKGGVNLCIRESFADIGQTILDAFSIARQMSIGKSFWNILP